MRIQNSVIIKKPIQEVFDITNDIEQWPNIFTEYAKSEVIEKNNDYIKFKLTTFPDNKGVQESWVSERFIDRKNWMITAKRLEPVYPFQFMDIKWIYKSVQEGTEMTWEQSFSMDYESGFVDEEVAENMNINTKVQMLAIKEKIESGYKNEK